MYIQFQQTQEFVHKAWHDESPAIGKVNFTMLSDRTRQLGDMFGVYVPEQGQDLRGTFIINPDLKISAYEIHDMRWSWCIKFIKKS